MINDGMARNGKKWKHLRHSRKGEKGMSNNKSVIGKGWEKWKAEKLKKHRNGCIWRESTRMDKNGGRGRGQCCWSATRRDPSPGEGGRVWWQSFLLLLLFFMHSSLLFPPRWLFFLSPPLPLPSILIIPISSVPSSSPPPRCPVGDDDDDHHHHLLPLPLFRPPPIDSCLRSFSFLVVQLFFPSNFLPFGDYPFGWSSTSTNTTTKYTQIIRARIYML